MCHESGLCVWGIPLCAAGVPSLPTEQVAAGLPLEAVAAAGEVGVVGGGRAVGPPGVEEAVVSALRAWRRLPPLEGGGSFGRWCGSRNGSQSH